MSIESASLRSAADQALASQTEVSRSRRASSESLGGKASAKAKSTSAGTLGAPSCALMRHVAMIGDV